MLLVKEEALVTWGKAPYSSNIISMDDLKICFSSSATWAHVNDFMRNPPNVEGMGRSRELKGEWLTKGGNLA